MPDAWIDSVPKWPDFKLERGDSSTAPSGMVVWRASTNAGRPVTPVFSLVRVVSELLTEEQVREHMEEDLWTAYRRAHPNGCPKVR